MAQGKLSSNSTDLDSWIWLTGHLLLSHAESDCIQLHIQQCCFPCFSLCLSPLGQHGTPFPHVSPSQWTSWSVPDWRSLCNQGQQSRQRQRWDRSSALRFHFPPACGSTLGSAKPRHSVSVNMNRYLTVHENMWSRGNDSNRQIVMFKNVSRHNHQTLCNIAMRQIWQSSSKWTLYTDPFSLHHQVYASL